MNQEQKDTWLKALRSGEYSQCQEFLQHCGGYCCLGVANEVCNLGSGDSVLLREGRGPGSRPIFLPLFVQEKLADMNDHGIPFSEIADYIEKHVPVTE